MAATARKLGWDDYQAFPDDGVRRQIIGGEVFVSPSPTIQHQRLSRKVFMALHLHVEAQELGEVFYAPLAVQLSPNDIVEPDVLVVLTGGDAEDEGSRFQGPPAVLVEVLSPSNRRTDLLRKRRLYEQAGVLEYWVVDPAAESVTRFHRGVTSDTFATDPALFSDKGGTVTTQVLSGFELDVAALFAPR